MLFPLVKKVCNRIEKLDGQIDGPLFIAQLREQRPTLDSELRAKGGKKTKLDIAYWVLGMAFLGFIKKIPGIAIEMKNMLESGSGDPSFRCVVAASLAYLVQPHDLMPDDLPGGYGFVDDAVLLNEACALSWEISGDAKRAEEARKSYQFMLIAVPDATRPSIQLAINGLAMTFNLLRSLDPMMAELQTQALIANPLQPIAAAAAPGRGGMSSLGSQMTSYPTMSGPQYSWRDGNTMGVNFPGGGGVATDGRDIFIL